MQILNSVGFKLIVVLFCIVLHSEKDATQRCVMLYTNCICKTISYELISNVYKNEFILLTKTQI